MYINDPHMLALLCTLKELSLCSTSWLNTGRSSHLHSHATIKSSNGWIINFAHYVYDHRSKILSLLFGVIYFTLFATETVDLQVKPIFNLRQYSSLTLQHNHGSRLVGDARSLCK